MKEETAEKQDEIQKRVSGFSLLISISALFILACFNVSSLSQINHSQIIDDNRLLIFSLAFITAISLIANSSIPVIRTLVHELKHAIVVLLSGNILRGIKVKTHSGNVSYQLYQEKLHFAAIVMLAPYSFPLFSLPVFITSIIIGDYYPVLFNSLLGLTIGCDLTMGLQEIHPEQTDLQNIRGGPILTGSYITLCHVNFLLLGIIWVMAGNQGLLITLDTWLTRMQTLLAL